MSINTRVRATSESVMGDAEVQHQRNRTRLVREVTRELDVPTSLTPALNHLLRFYFVGCEKEVSNLINRPVLSFFGSRVSGTGAYVVVKRVYGELFWNHRPREEAPSVPVLSYQHTRRRKAGRGQQTRHNLRDVILFIMNR